MIPHKQIILQIPSANLDPSSGEQRCKHRKGRKQQQTKTTALRVVVAVGGCICFNGTNGIICSKEAQTTFVQHTTQSVIQA